MTAERIRNEEVETMIDDSSPSGHFASIAWLSRSTRPGRPWDSPRRTRWRRTGDAAGPTARGAVVFASAPSQVEFLAALADTWGLDWSRVTAFHMEIHRGVERRAAELAHFIRTHLPDEVHVGTAHYIDGATSAPRQECERYAALLDEAPIDLVCMGIGENGHIATIRLWRTSPIPWRSKLVELDETCRQQQVNDGCFPNLGSVPTHAIPSPCRR